MFAEEKLYWCLSHGIVMSTGEYAEYSADCQVPMPILRHAPIAIDPFPFPERSFKKSVALSSVFNNLTDKVANDQSWLCKTLHLIPESDKFTQELMHIYRSINNKEVVSWHQPITLAINRSDYMQHKLENDDRDLLQVEINTIASSFGALSNMLTEMHSSFSHLYPTRANIPPNNTIQGICHAIFSAHKLFLQQTNVNEADSVVVMIVQPGEKNFSDQMLIQFELLSRFGVNMIRKSLADINAHGKLDESTGYLSVDNKIASLVYYRAGYTPDDYASVSEWKARLLIERSIAVKCPNIAYHLAGSKKVQQALAEPDMLEYFLHDDEGSIRLLRSVFAGLYSLDPVDDSNMSKAYEISMQNRKRALEKPEQYVMKPQREGGGNNLYNKELHRSLSTLSSEELSAFILMERISPPVQEATMMRDGKIIKTDTLCELGVYGVFLADGARVIINEYVGYLLRVKPSTSDEGGVAAGYAVLGVPHLTNEL